MSEHETEEESWKKSCLEVAQIGAACRFILNEKMNTRGHKWGREMRTLNGFVAAVGNDSGEVGKVCAQTQCYRWRGRHHSRRGVLAILARRSSMEQNSEETPLRDKKNDWSFARCEGGSGRLMIFDLET